MAPPPWAACPNDDDVLDLLSSDEEDDVEISQPAGPARVPLERLEGSRTAAEISDDAVASGLDGKGISEGLDFAECGDETSETPVKANSVDNDAATDCALPGAVGAAIEKSLTPFYSGGSAARIPEEAPKDSGSQDYADDDDEDDEMLLAPVFLSSRKKPLPERRRVLPELGHNGGPSSAVGTDLVAHEERQGVPGRDFMLLDTAAGAATGVAAVDRDDSVYAGAHEEGAPDLADLNPDMNAGTSGIAVNSLFERDPHASEVGSDMTEDQVRELLTCNNMSADAITELPTPPELAVTLMKHQRQALHWMVRREVCEKPARHPNGGILADDQGFGKTLSTISLMLTNKPPVDSRGKPPPWGTLIVCPLSLLGQWERELYDKIEPAFRPSVLVYHGPNRPKNPHLLVKYDVVITTYAILTSEYPKVLKEANGAVADPPRRRKKGPLFKCRFFRVVLDEAQAIKNRRSECFAASFEIRADRRWVLSGTPIQNSIDDMYSLFLFLHYHVVSTYAEWKMRWKNRMEAKSPAVRNRAFKRFQAVLGVVLLRRAKHDKTSDGRPVIDLPPRIVESVEVDFNVDEREFYAALEKNTLAKLDKFTSNAGATPDFMNLLLLLLRLRQACSHPSLCQWSENAGYVFTDEQLDGAADARTFKSLPADVKERLLVELAPGNRTEHSCPICMDVICGQDGVVTPCGHIFCYADYTEWTQQNDSCPSCRSQIADVSNVAGLTQVRMEVHALLRKKLQAKFEMDAALKPKPLRKNGLDLSGFGKRCRFESSTEAVAQVAQKRVKLPLNDEPQEEPEPDKLEDASGANLVRGDERGRKFVQTAKIRAFIRLVESMIREGDEKALVFSQWTRMLDLIAVPLFERGIRFERLDGTMDANQRAAAIAEFKKRSDCRLFLISLKAGGCGLNLTEANHVHMLDLWWNPAVEDQAIDRVHRIGQEKTVTVHRYKVRGTVEDKIVELQEKKRMLSEGALGVEGMQTLGRRRLGLQELWSLFRDVAEHVREAEANTGAGPSGGGNAQTPPGLASNLIGWAAQQF